MDNYTALYWLTRLDSIISMFEVFVILSGCVFFGAGLFKVMMGDDMDDDHALYCKKGLRWSFSILVISTICLIFIPSKNDVILIYAGGKTMYFVQSDSSLQKIPGQTTQIISEYLNKSIEEINQPENERKKE